MKTEPKLALVRGALQKLQVQGMILSARRVLEETIDRVNTKPSRDIDLWSDQAEVAFYEDTHGRRA